MTTPSKITCPEPALDDVFQTGPEGAEKESEDCSSSDVRMSGTAASDEARPDNGNQEATVQSTSDATLQIDRQASAPAEASHTAASTAQRQHATEAADPVRPELDVSANSVLVTESDNAQLLEVNLDLSSLQIGQALSHQDPTPCFKPPGLSDLANISNTRESLSRGEEPMPIQEGSLDSDINIPAFDNDYPALEVQKGPENLEDTASEREMDTETTPDLITSMETNRQPSPASVGGSRPATRFVS